MNGIKFTTAVVLGFGKNGTLRKIPRTKDFEVIEEFFWWVDYDSQTNKIVVPRGFVTDLGTIPRILLPFIEKNRIAFVLHDFLIGEKYNLYTRKEADLILLEALNAEGVGKIERAFIYIGVRIGAFLGKGKPNLH